MEREIPQLGETALGYEDVGEGWVANVRLQFEDSHLPDRILIASKSLNELRNIDAIHGAAMCTRRLSGCTRCIRTLRST